MIKTVGYTYLCAAGIKECEVGINEHILSKEKCLRLLEMSFNMVEKIKTFKTTNGKRDINIKIGIHVGACIAGIIGYHKP